MKVRFWGVRGSIASPGQTYIALWRQYHLHRGAGPTMGHLIILDAGTGIFPLAQQLLKSLPVQANIFMTHSHWDHIQGLPFFTPLYIPGNKVRIHGAFDIVSQRGIEQVMEIQLQYSFFPVREAEMKANIDYRNVAVGEAVTIGDAKVTPLLLNHPVVNFGYRIDCNGKSVFFTGDHEPWLNIYSREDEGYGEFQQIIDQQQTQLDAALAGLDILIADSSYTASEYQGKLGWGHGTLEGSIAWGRRLGVKTLVCTHHEPERSDDALEAVFDAALAANGVTATGGGTTYLLSREGMELVL
jgi:phosphoribosyl 1,2-cyclic phosphodiesterase